MHLFVPEWVFGVRVAGNIVGKVVAVVIELVAG